MKEASSFLAVFLAQGSSKIAQMNTRNAQVCNSLSSAENVDAWIENLRNPAFK